jgi:hypothetical protein
MKKIISMLALATAAAFAARAGVLDLSLDSATLSGAAGSVLQFSGTLTNTTDAVLWLNGDDFNLTTLDPSAFDDSPFYTNTPTGFLAANGNTGDIGLFNITIFGSFAPGKYNGSFTVIGGAGADSQDILGTANFTAQVLPPSGVPESSTLPLLGAGFALLLAVSLCRSRFRATVEDDRTNQELVEKRHFRITPWRSWLGNCLQ